MAREFDTYVRDSLLAEQTVRAVDVTQADLARDVVAWEQAQWGVARSGTHHRRS